MRAHLSSVPSFLTFIAVWSLPFRFSKKISAALPLRISQIFIKISIKVLSLLSRKTSAKTVSSPARVFPEKTVCKYPSSATKTASCSSQDMITSAKAHLAPGFAADPLKDALAALKNVFEDRRIRVALDLPRTMPAVAIDRAQMEQVFFNLMKNALEAMKDGGELSIEIKHDDMSVSVVFRDSGVGMSDEALAHLFEPYRTTKKKGTGLGLMMSRRIVAAHGGEIAVASEEGRGTTFTVRLPRLEKRVRALT